MVVKKRAAQEGLMGERFDVVVWGATGFTGRLVAEYLCERYGVNEGLRWALGGRDLGKLERVRGELAAKDAAASSLPLLVADSGDERSLRALAAQAAVVCTTVGPYARYGSGLVAACVAEGADYCDLTGESPWIRRMIDAHHAEAARLGRRIVHCCGFDSIPSDLGVFFLQREAARLHGAPLEEITFYMGRVKGGFSGGTVSSLFGVAQEARDPAVRRVLFDPYGLNPEGERQGPDGRDPQGIQYDKDISAWTAPFLMGPINTRVVRRSHALQGYPYGRGFRYRELMSLPSGPKGWAMGQAVRAGLGALMVAAVSPRLSGLVQGRLLPSPGRGAERGGSARRASLRAGWWGRGARPAARRCGWRRGSRGGATRGMARRRGCWGRRRCAWPRTGRRCPRARGC
jgi:short subunit dehydrogenase-like uncharacterized protein